MKIIPIAKETHKDWSYVGLPHYLHTKNDAIAPILTAEIDRVISTNPIIFIDKGDTIGMYSLQSLLPEINMMIDDKGKWLGNYIPARYRSLPFVLASQADNKSSKDKVLCFIEDLNCVAQNIDKKSTKIFEKEELSQDMKRVFEFLVSIEKNELITKKALLSIKELDILEEWPLSLKLADGEKKMAGLKKINAEKLKSLSKDNLYHLNTSGGLDICYANLLSLNNVENLKRILINRQPNITENEEIKNDKSLRDLTLEKQNKEKKEEMDNLVKNLLTDNET